MKIALASYRFINGNIDFNISQIENALKNLPNDVDLICFGETFLQGFDALHWNYIIDQKISTEQDSDLMRRVCALSAKYETDLGIGYIERCVDTLYSSYAIIERGQILHNYRRISLGWKEAIADEHYREGEDTREFEYRGQWFQVALCGDLWDYPERFRTDHILLWPVYVNFTQEEWATTEAEYACQAQKAARRTLYINSVSDDPDALGGSAYFVDGKVEKNLPYGEEGILIVEV